MFKQATLTAAVATITISANAAPIALIDEDFNNPLDGATNNTNLRDNPANFPDWFFADTGGLTPQYKVGATDGAPVGAGDGHVKFDSYGGGYTMQYDTGHNWADGDEFTLSLNATEQNWNFANDRFMVVSIRETARSGNNLTGAIVWTQTQELIRDTNHDEASEGWGPNNTFSYTFDTDDFLGGTEGTALSFEIKGLEGTDRGFFFDNVLLTVTPVPEPGSLALMGLGGLLIARRRRG